MTAPHATYHYRGYTIVHDRDEYNNWFYIYVTEDGDPIEVASVSSAREIIDDMIADTAEFYGSASWAETNGDNY